MFIKRLRSYDFCELLRIVLFKLLYRTKLIIEKILIKNKVYIKFNINSNKLMYVRPIDSIALKILNFNSEICQLKKRNIPIFGEYFKLTHYLQDPISKKYWPRDTFFSESLTKINGYGDVKYVLELNKLNHIVYVAAVYFHSKDESLITYIDNQLIKWENEVKYERSVANKIAMDLAFRCINLIMVTLLCRDNDLFRQTVYPKIHKILVLSERQIRNFSTPRWFKTGNGANHVIGEMVGLIITQKWLALIEDKKCNSKHLKQEYKWLYQTLKKLITPNGTYLENSSNYTRLVSEFLVIFDYFEESFNCKNERFRERYLEPILRYLNALSYEGRLPNFGDNDAASVLIPFKKDSQDITPLKQYLSYLEHGHKENNLEKFSQDGHFIWDSNDENFVHVFIRYKHWSIFNQGAAAHLHCDLLSVLLNFKGYEIFIDKGCYFYNQTFDIKKSAFSTKSHNTLYVEGLEQADYVSGGWYNYPKSQTLQDTIGDSIFIASVSYKEFEHIRKVSYDGNIISICDTVNNINRKVFLHYLLGKDVIPSKVDSNKLRLLLPSNDSIILEIEGVDEISLKPDDFYPHYGRVESTFSIKAQLNKPDVITKIIF